MTDFLYERAEALVNSYNSGDLDAMMDFLTEDSKLSDFLFRAVNLDKTATRPFFAKFIDENENVTFSTRNVSGTPEFVAHEMAIDFQAGSDVEALGITKGQFVTLAGVAVQSWRKTDLGADAKNVDTVGPWKIFEQKDYFFLEEKRDS